MVAAFDYCLHGRGGAAPSIDTAMHGLVDAAARRPPAPRLGHRAGHRGRRRGADQGVLRRPGGVGALAAPGLPARAGHRRGQARQPARDRRASSAATASPPGARPARSARRNSLEIIRTAQRVPRRARPARAVRRGGRRLRAAARGRAPRAGRRPGAGDPRAGVHRPAAGRALHRQRRGAGLPRPRGAPARWPRSAPPARTTSCAPRSGRWCSTCPPTAPLDEVVARLRELHAEYRGRLRRLLRAPRRRRTRRPCAVPTRRSCSCPGVGMFSFGKDKQTARVAGEFYVNAINVMRGAEAVSTLRADRGAREVPDRVLGAGGGQARADAEAEAPGRPGRAGHRRRLGHRPGHRAPAGRRGRLRGGRRPRR